MVEPILIAEYQRVFQRLKNIRVEMLKIKKTEENDPNVALNEENIQGHTLCIQFQIM